MVKILGKLNATFPLRKEIWMDSIFCDYKQRIEFEEIPLTEYLIQFLRMLQPTPEAILTL